MPQISWFCLILSYHYGGTGSRSTKDNHDDSEKVQWTCTALSAPWLQLWMTLGICLNPKYYRQLLILLGHKDKNSMSKSNAHIMSQLLLNQELTPTSSQKDVSWLSRENLHYSCVSPLLSRYYHMHNTSDTRCLEFPYTKQFCDTCWVFYILTQFWHYLNIVSDPTG